MNKKLISTSLALSICAIAIVPIYKHLDLNTNTKNTNAISEWNQLNSEKLLLKEQLLATDDKLTYTQNDEKAVISTEAKTATKEATNDKNTITENATASKTSSSTKTSNTTNKTAVSTTKSKTSTNSTTSSSTKSATNTTTSKSTTSTTSSSPAVSKTTTATTSTATNRGSTSTVTSSKASAVISTAKSFLGVPYVWGGTSSSGFDCSGFTQYVLAKNGITVPRTAAEQYKVGTSVSKSNLRVGDLVFFTTYKEGPSHLGFYLGDGNFIHASSSKGVTISSLSSTYYSSRYIGARRVIN